MSQAPKEPARASAADADTADEGGSKQTFLALNRPQSAPLIPEAGAGGAPLTAVIAVISFLAVLAMASALIIHQSASQWTNALQAELTVQVKGADRADIERETQLALAILNQTPGVISAHAMARTETAALLEPWLGEGNAEKFLNIPAIIQVTTAASEPTGRIDIDALRSQLALEAPGASLEDHAQWRQRLTNAARSGQMLAFAVFVIVMGAGCAIAIFAARAGLAANHEIVSLLHLIGATDIFIASEIQRRFFFLGLRGALIGLLAALIALTLASWGVNAGIGADHFLPRFSISPWTALWLLTVPLLTCLATAVTARLTVLQTLRGRY